MDMPRAVDTPLRGARVLITRATDDAAPLRSRLEELGATVLLLPTIEILPPFDMEPLDRALRDLKRYGWIVFTSRYAVETVFRRMGALGLSQTLPPSVRIAAVGPSTAVRLAERGYRDVVAPRSENARARDLAEALCEVGVNGQRLLFPAADLARQELRQVLEDGGAEVHTVIAYRTATPIDPDRGLIDALCHGEIDVVAIASPSAIHNLAAMLEPDAWCLKRTGVACIGPTTAEAIRGLDIEPIVSKTANIDGLVEAIVAAFGAQN
ncbi:MAG: uroporphyrinogen-III synthase [Chloroflexota bacterium]